MFSSNVSKNNTWDSTGVGMPEKLIYGKLSYFIEVKTQVSF